MLYLAIPAHNEVATIGVLLWRIRTVLAEFPREYEVVVYDDASTDATADVASQYEQAMPVTVIRGERHLGYAGAVDRVLRHVAQQTRYPRRDAVLLLQGDFTDPPGIVPEFARRFEGGADLVVGERLGVADAPVAVRRLFKAAQWAMRPFVRVEGVKDTTASMRLVRISALRDALRAMGDAPLVTGDTWTTNADLLLRLAPHARRVEAVPMEPTYGVRMRETRRVALRDALSALKWAWSARGRRAVVGSRAEPIPESERRGGRGAGKRREETPELSVDRLREKIRERDGSRGIDGEPEKPRDRRRGRDRDRDRGAEPRERAGRPERAERSGRPERSEPRAEARPEARPESRAEPRAPQRTERPAKPRGERPERAAASRTEPGAADARPARPPRGERPARPRRDEPRTAVDANFVLDDPFAPPAPRIDPLTRALEPRPALPDQPAAPVEPGASAGPADARDAMPPVRPSPRPVDAEAADDHEADEGDEEGEETPAGGDIDATGPDGAPRRRRRRNRRSRRGRRREGTEGEEGPAPLEPRLEGEPVAPRPDRDAEDDSDAGDAADEGEDAGGDEGTHPAARRRGRRGRRGGARRSRGRRDRQRGPEGGEGGEGGEVGGGSEGGSSSEPGE